MNVVTCYLWVKECVFKVFSVVFKVQNLRKLQRRVEISGKADLGTIVVSRNFIHRDF